MLLLEACSVLVMIVPSTLIPFEEDREPDVIKDCVPFDKITVPATVAPAEPLIKPAVTIEPEAFKEVVEFDEMMGLKTLTFTFPDTVDGLKLAAVRVPLTFKSFAKRSPVNVPPPEDEIVPLSTSDCALENIAVERIFTFEPLKDDAAPASGSPKTTPPCAVMPKKLPGPAIVPDETPSKSIAPDTLRVSVITPPTSVAP